MAIISPTVTAYDAHEYREQMERIEPFAKRVHIDLMDGEFAPTTSIPPSHMWWPRDMQADVHLMYQRPMEHIETLIKHHPNLVIIHNEAEVHHMEFAAKLHAAGIQSGLAILSDTPIEYAFQIMHSFDHILIFSGDLGRHGGTADLGLLDKVRKIREHHPDAEIGWDGGINDSNAKHLAEAGVSVLNVGGYIQNSENPAEKYTSLLRVLE